MGNRLKVRLGVFLTLALLISYLIPIPVTAAGLGVGPSNLEIVDAVRGNEYKENIYIFNTNPEENTYRLSTSTEIDGWVSFFKPGTSGEAINQVTVPANDKVTLVADFIIPTDAAEQFYQGQIMVATIPPEQGPEQTSGSSVSVQLPINVTIRIAGTAVITGNVSNITTKDTEAGLPVVIAVDFTNNGTIDVAPTIIARVVKGDRQFAEIKHNTTRVQIGENKVIELVWDSQGQNEGAYEIRVEVKLAGKVIGSKDLVVNLMAAGSIKVEGTLTELQYDGKPSAGAITKIIGSFKNASSIAVRAHLFAEIYEGGALIGTAQGEDFLVAGGKEDNLFAYFTPEKKGNYVIKGQVVYQGERTEMKEINFNVGNTDVASNNLLYPVGGIVAVLAFTACGLFAVKRWRRTAQPVKTDNDDISARTSILTVLSTEPIDNGNTVKAVKRPRKTTQRRKVDSKASLVTALSADTTGNGGAAKTVKRPRKTVQRVKAENKDIDVSASLLTALSADTTDSRSTARAGKRVGSLGH